MGEALISRRGSGEKVTIDGVKADREYNLQSFEELMLVSTMPFPNDSSSGISQTVVFQDKIYLIPVANAPWNQPTVSDCAYTYDNGAWTQQTLIISGHPGVKPFVHNNKLYYGYNYRLFEFNGIDQPVQLYWFESFSYTSPENGESYSAYKGGDGVVVINDEIHLFGWQNHYKLENSKAVQISTLPYDAKHSKIFTYNNKLYCVFNPGYSINGHNIQKHYVWNGESSWTDITEQVKGELNGAPIFRNWIILEDGVHAYGRNDAELEGNHFLFDGTTWRKLENTPSLLYGSMVKYNGFIHYLSAGDLYNSQDHLIYLKGYKEV